jgi:hypothetical protein
MSWRSRATNRRRREVRQTPVWLDLNDAEAIARFILETR